MTTGPELIQSSPGRTQSSCAGTTFTASEAGATNGSGVISMTTRSGANSMMGSGSTTSCDATPSVSALSAITAVGSLAAALCVISASGSVALGTSARTASAILFATPCIAGCPPSMLTPYVSSSIARVRSPIGMTKSMYRANSSAAPSMSPPVASVAARRRCAVRSSGSIATADQRSERAATRLPAALSIAAPSFSASRSLRLGPSSRTGASSCSSSIRGSVCPRCATHFPLAGEDISPSPGHSNVAAWTDVTYGRYCAIRSQDLPSSRLA